MIYSIYFSDHIVMPYYIVCISDMMAPYRKSSVNENLFQLLILQVVSPYCSQMFHTCVIWIPNFHN